MKITSFFFRTLITIILSLLVLIGMKGNSHFKELVYQNVYEKSFPFLKVGVWYQNLFGSPFPFEKYMKTKATFQETLTYQKKENYLEGVKLTIEDTYPIPVLQDGLVVFVGEKEDYGKVVIVEQLDGVDCWYGNLSSSTVKLYDYVEAGSLLGVAEKNLYLVYKKDGVALPYEEYSL